MKYMILKLFLNSIVLVEILLFYVIATSHTITLNEVKKPTIKPWPTCATVPMYRVRCDPLKDPFVTTTTWHSFTPHPDR